MDMKSNNRRIIIFLMLTFVMTYGVEIFLIMPMAASIDLKQAYLAERLSRGVMFIPAIGALITRLATKEKGNRENLMLSLKLKGNLKYYGFAWLGFIALTVLGVGLYFFIFPSQFDADIGYARALLNAQIQNTGNTATQDQVKKMILLQMIIRIFCSPILNIVTCFGEEWGWRGYLLPRMLKKFKIVPAILASGVIWGLWYMPLIAIGYNYGFGYRGFPFVGMIAMCLFCIVIGILLSYVTIRTGSCIPAIIGNGTLNGIASMGLYFTSLQNPYNVFLGPAPTGLIGGAGFILTAGVLLYRLYKEEKQKIFNNKNS